MQKRVVGLLRQTDCLYSVFQKARWPMNLLPMRYIICRMRKAIGHEILSYIIKQCRPSRAGHEASRLEFLQMPLSEQNDSNDHQPVK